MGREPRDGIDHQGDVAIARKAVVAALDQRHLHIVAGKRRGSRPMSGGTSPSSPGRGAVAPDRREGDFTVEQQVASPDWKKARVVT